eukprot:COSAG02_NODE_1028_length_15086_cov_21.563555_6_plen_112_part_00
MGEHAQGKRKFCVVATHYSESGKTDRHIVEWRGGHMPKKRRKAPPVAGGGGRAQRAVNSRYARPRGDAAADAGDDPGEGGGSAGSGRNPVGFHNPGKKCNPQLAMSTLKRK